MLVSDCIAAALRHIGQLAAGQTVGIDDFTIGLDALNRLQRAMFGTVIGPPLTPQDCAGLNNRQAESGGEYMIPAGNFTLTAPADPRGGARFGVVDAALDFAANACVVNRNGRLLNGAAANLTLSANGTAIRFWFRPDRADWIEEADYAGGGDVLPFPAGLAAYAPYMLAVAVTPQFGADQRADIVATAGEGRQAFARAYGRKGRNQNDAPLGLPAAPTPAQGQ